MGDNTADKIQEWEGTVKNKGKTKQGLKSEGCRKVRM